MKTLRNIIYGTLALVTLGIGAVTANGTSRGNDR
jgi:hypothetical protein